ncbi:2'-5' RNA ligase superfamily-domain-containing protein [Phaeosphaeriaceae sp. PMI808]|nr:2'-5' RNA ligase superfamily-domain-containing protein [Phaeosphaeriaceae sp. PMI808]
MANRLPAHLSHTSALALLLPSDIAPPIEAIRRVHDKHFARWPPHINLLYPFLVSPSEIINQGEEAVSPQLQESIRTRIQKAVKPIEPFQVSLHADPPGVFSHGKKSKTVWLGPSTQSIQILQAALQAEFSECDADQRPFTPHLSVGQASSDMGAQKLKEEIKSSIAESNAQAEGAPVALDWYIDKVYVIKREGYHDRFKVIGSINLGKE